MYLVKLDLDVLNRKTYDYLQNPNLLHGALCAAVEKSREEARLLFRTVTERRRNSIYVYTRIPLREKKLPAGLQFIAQRDLTEWIYALQPSTLLSYDLLAVPSKKLFNDSSKNSRRVILRNSDERRDWVRRHFNTSGCRIQALDEGCEKRVHIYKGHENRSFIINGYTYTGYLEVVRPEALEHLLESGIGPEKAYGFGMVMIGRP